MKIYFGTIGWGWKMYGIGYKTKWFCGFSMQRKRTPDIQAKVDELIRHQNPEPEDIKVRGTLWPNTFVAPKLQEHRIIVAVALEREACAKRCEDFGKTLEVGVGDCFAEAVRANE